MLKRLKRRGGEGREGKGLFVVLGVCLGRYFLEGFGEVEKGEKEKEKKKRKEKEKERKEKLNKLFFDFSREKRQR